MGFWDWFRPAPQPPAPERDLVWLSKSAKLSELAGEARVANGPVLILAHFPESLGEVRKALTRVGTPGEDVAGPLTAAELVRRTRTTDRPAPLLALVSQLRPDPPADAIEAADVRILVAERHFLRARDDHALRFAAGLGRVPVTFFLALDEPLLKQFAGPWMTDMLRQLGMKETDAVESKMILRRIRQAQARYERSAVDEPARSSEEWASRNGLG